MKKEIDAAVCGVEPKTGVSARLDVRWEPTEEQMDDLAELFIQADEDPDGMVVVTRTD
jgi:hypothetical protein